MTATVRKYHSTWRQGVPFPGSNPDSVSLYYNLSTTLNMASGSWTNSKEWFKIYCASSLEGCPVFEICRLHWFNKEGKKMIQNKEIHL